MHTRICGDVLYAYESQRQVNETVCRDQDSFEACNMLCTQIELRENFVEWNKLCREQRAHELRAAQPFIQIYVTKYAKFVCCRNYTCEASSAGSSIREYWNHIFAENSCISRRILNDDSNSNFPFSPSPNRCCASKNRMETTEMNLWKFKWNFFLLIFLISVPIASDCIAVNAAIHVLRSMFFARSFYLTLVLVTRSFVSLPTDVLPFGNLTVSTKYARPGIFSSDGWNAFHFNQRANNNNISRVCALTKMHSLCQLRARSQRHQHLYFY